MRCLATGDSTGQRQTPPSMAGLLGGANLGIVAPACGGPRIWGTGPLKMRGSPPAARWLGPANCRQRPPRLHDPAKPGPQLQQRTGRQCPRPSRTNPGLSRRFFDAGPATQPASTAHEPLTVVMASSSRHAQPASLILRQKYQPFSQPHDATTSPPGLGSAWFVGVVLAASCERDAIARDASGAHWRRGYRYPPGLHDRWPPVKMAARLSRSAWYKSPSSPCSMSGLNNSPHPCYKGPSC